MLYQLSYTPAGQRPLEGARADGKGLAPPASPTKRPFPKPGKPARIGAVHAPGKIIAPDMLMLAYRSGIFPMSDSRDDPEVFWVEPRLRAILPLDGFRCSRSLARTLRRGRFRVTCNAAFDAVMEACAAPRRDTPETWISERIAASYRALHAEGIAHSIECWQDEAAGDPAAPPVPRLVGGLYGVGFDRVFCGESMFSRVPDASKVALAWLVAALRQCRAELLDCQFMTEHLASLGAIEIPQARYLALLRHAQRTEPRMPYSVTGAAADGAGDGEATAAGAVLALPDGFAALLAAAKAAGSSSSPGNFIAQSFTQTS